MAAQTPHRQDADEPGSRVDEVDSLDDLDAPGDGVTDADDEATEPADRALWEEVRIDPVEIALPAGVGFTLRAYRSSTDLTPTEIDEDEDDDPFEDHQGVLTDDDEDGEVVILDEDFKALLAESDEDTDKDPDKAKSADAETTEDAGAASDKESTEDAEDAEDSTDEKAATEPAEEVPAFLTHRGRLLLFKSPESLVNFVRSGAPNDLAQLDTWPELAERIQPADIDPLDDDTYELDLVVENLRGGSDTWDVNLLIEAGEIARDLGHALRLPPVITALSPGSPLDDLDEALRGAAGGGIGGFMGRRRLRRIGAQQASLGWRTIIGKISAAVDWRD